ncbi:MULTISPECIES: HlyD family secretion protein [Pseudomonas]|uniref:HlyD family secretion protein n=1 Tax=Pseudomonas TaxID=286 RepID=UPI001E585154|nr:MULTISPECIES: biotin/lipoyl-binding protein [Pseudomonas]
MTDSMTVPSDVEHTASHWSPPPRGRLQGIIMVLAAIGVITIVLYIWKLPPFDAGLQQTDNAYVRGRTTVIAPQVSGYIVQVAGQDFAQVKRGEVLVRIDDEVYQAQVDEATANLAVAKADLSNNQQAHAARMAGIESQVAATAGAQARLLRARADMQRANALVMDGAISTRERDQARADFSQARAEVQQAGAQESIAREELRTVDVGREGLEAQVRVAQAKLRAAQIDLNHTVIQAPEDGVLGEVGVRWANS